MTPSDKMIKKIYACYILMIVSNFLMAIDCFLKEKLTQNILGCFMVVVGFISLFYLIKMIKMAKELKKVQLEFEKHLKEEIEKQKKRHIEKLTIMN